MRKEQPLVAQAVTLISVLPNGWINTYLSLKQQRHQTNSQRNDATICGRLNYRSVSTLKRHNTYQFPWNHTPRNFGNSCVAYDVNEPKFKRLHISVTERQPMQYQARVSQILCWSRVMITRQFRVSLPLQTTTYHSPGTHRCVPTANKKFHLVI